MTDEEQQIALMAALLVRGASRAQMEAACRQKFGHGKAKFDELLGQLRRKLSTEYEAGRPYAKATQAARLEGYLTELVKDKKWAVVTRVEALLADIYGTREPVVVSVSATLSAAAVQVISSLSDEQMGEMLARARERRRLAEIATQVPKILIEAGKSNGAAKN